MLRVQLTAKCIKGEADDLVREILVMHLQYIKIRRAISLRWCGCCGAVRDVSLRVLTCLSFFQIYFSDFISIFVTYVQTNKPSCYIACCCWKLHCICNVECCIRTALPLVKASLRWPGVQEPQGALRGDRRVVHRDGVRRKRRIKRHRRCAAGPVSQLPYLGFMANTLPAQHVRIGHCASCMSPLTRWAVLPNINLKPFSRHHLPCGRVPIIALLPSPDTLCTSALRCTRQRGASRKASAIGIGVCKALLRISSAGCAVTMVASGDRLFPRLFTPEISAFYEDAFAKARGCTDSLQHLHVKHEHLHC